MLCARISRLASLSSLIVIPFVYGVAHQIRSPILQTLISSLRDISPPPPRPRVECCRESSFFGPSVYEKHFSLKARESERAERGEGVGDSKTIMCIFGVIVTSLSSFVDSLVHCYLEIFFLFSPTRSGLLVGFGRGFLSCVLLLCVWKNRIVYEWRREAKAKRNHIKMWNLVCLKCSFSCSFFFNLAHTINVLSSDLHRMLVDVKSLKWMNITARRLKSRFLLLQHKTNNNCHLLDAVWTLKLCKIAASRRIFFFV